MTTVLLVEDDTFTRTGITKYLSEQSIEVLEAEDCQSARKLLQIYQPDVAILDINLPQTKGMKATNAGIALGEEIKSLTPSTGVIFLSHYAHFRQEIVSLMQKGFVGFAYTIKPIDPPLLKQYINDVRKGYIFIAPEATDQRLLVSSLKAQFSTEELPLIETAVKYIPELSPRELDVARLVASAWNTRSIANELHIVQGAVQTYKTQIFQKLHLSPNNLDGDYFGSRTRGIILAKAFILHDLKMMGPISP